MHNLWNDNIAEQYRDDLLALRVYSSRLLGQDPNLVLHGGGNTSVKLTTTDYFGEPESLLYVKGSGWDLGNIEVAGFAPVKLETLQKMARLPHLSDSDMVKLQRAAMTDPAAPNPSVEAILHALIPFTYVDHTHADAVVALTNTENGRERVHTIYGDRVLIVPYVMPGFILAKKIADLTRAINWENLEGMVLLNHGVFSFGPTAKSSYERMIRLVTAAEDYLQAHAALPTTTSPILQKSSPSFENSLFLAKLRKTVAEVKQSPVIAHWDSTPLALQFSQLPTVTNIATQGPLTPDHVIRTKAKPLILNSDFKQEIAEYVASYEDYFKRHATAQLIQLNAAPCWAVWLNNGLISFGNSVQEAQIVSDIKDHTIWAIQVAQRLGGWRALPEKDIFEMEYWELEQVKLKKSSQLPVLQGKIILVTGAASGIGQACVKVLLQQGAAVIALDIDPKITHLFATQQVLGIACDVTLESAIQAAVIEGVSRFGGLDGVISNAGTFPISESLAQLQMGTWEKSLAVNLTSHQRLLKVCIPYLAEGIEPAVVMMGSKNVPAPGPGAAAYSVAKAGQTQLARVAALELAPLGIRVNVLHPNAVFDTGIWTPEVLEKRAQHYGVTVEEYKKNNLLRTEITSQSVASLACAMLGPLFAKTTGAQIPIDGGNERVI